MWGKKEKYIWNFVEIYQIVRKYVKNIRKYGDIYRNIQRK